MSPVLVTGQNKTPLAATMHLRTSFQPQKPIQKTDPKTHKRMMARGRSWRRGAGAPYSAAAGAGWPCERQLANQVPVWSRYT